MNKTEHGTRPDEGVLYLKKLVLEIRKGIDARLELLILNSAIVIPDICGSAEKKEDMRCLMHRRSTTDLL